MESAYQHERLDDTTIFINLTFHQMEQHLTHRDMMDALQRFLNDFLIPSYTRDLTPSTILHLTDLVLETQVYFYENKLFHKVKGHCQTIPLVNLLTNIYVLYCLIDLRQCFHEQSCIFTQ